MYGASMDLAEWRIWWRREGSDELSDLLMLWWDPIDVRGISDTADEYDRYLGPIAAMLEHGCAIDELSDYLGRVRVEDIGLAGNPALDRLAAKKICAWYRAATARTRSR